MSSFKNVEKKQFSSIEEVKYKQNTWYVQLLLFMYSKSLTASTITKLYLSTS